MLRVVLTLLLFDERWCRLLLLAHLLLLHDGSRLLRLPTALAMAPLRQVSSQIDLVCSTLHKRLSLVSRHVMLNRVLQGLALTLDAVLHLLAQLPINLEVLNLQLAIPLFLHVD